MLNERELQVYNAIKENDDGRGVDYTICLMFSVMDEDEFNRIADALVQKGKVKKFVNAFGVTLYSIKDEVEDKISKGRGNYFSSIERKFAAADKQTIMNTAHNEMIACIQTSGMEHVKPILMLFMMAASIGLCGKDKLSVPQKEMVRDIVTDIFEYKGDMQTFYDKLSEGYSEDDFAMLETFCNTALNMHVTEPAMHLLGVILSFAYIDGKLDDTVGARLESIYGMILLENIFTQGKDEKPDDGEVRKREELKRAEEEKARKKAQEAAHRAEEEKTQSIQHAHDAWKEECKVVEQRRSKELQKLLQEEKSTMIATVESNKQKAIDAANEIIESENCRLRDAEAALAALGFFSFSQKKQQRTIIADARSRILSAENAKTKSQADYQIAKNEIVKKLHSRRIDLQAKLEKEYPFPSEPGRPDNASGGFKGSLMTEHQRQNELIKQDILNFLTAEPATATDIYNMLNTMSYPYLTNQRLSALLRTLVLDGKVTRSDVRGRTFFSLA